jgi:7-carboxy-7-deazaguanine synthase
VKAIIDVKCPGSGGSAKMCWSNLEALSPTDEVKFVIRDRADFDYARDVVDRFNLRSRAHVVLFSPVFGVLAPDELARWILERACPRRRSGPQIHLSPDARGV